MAQVKIKRGTIAEINNTDIIDGQLLFTTDEDNNKSTMYMDVGDERKRIKTDSMKQTQGTNLIPYPYNNQRLYDNGASILQDGTIRINRKDLDEIEGRVVIISVIGTNDTYPILLKKGTYTLSGCPSGGSSSSYALGIENQNRTLYKFDYGNGITFDVEEDAYVQVNLYITSTTEDEFLEFKPMLEYGSEVREYQPTTLTNATLAKERESIGENLIEFPYSYPNGYTDGAMTYTYDLTNNGDGTITINGTIDSDDTFSFFEIESSLVSSNKYKFNKKYTLTVIVENGEGKIDVGFRDTQYENIAYFSKMSNEKRSITFEIPYHDNYEEDATFNLELYAFGTVTLNDCKVKVQIEEGSVAHAYQPTPQSNVTLANNLSNLVVTQRFTHNFSYDAGAIGTRGYQGTVNIQKEGYTPISIVIVYASSSGTYHPLCMFRRDLTIAYVNAYRCATGALNSASIDFDVTYVKN